MGGKWGNESSVFGLMLEYQKSSESRRRKRKKVSVEEGDKKR